MIGELIDHYRVLELIGRGAMGVVYKALDVNLDRTVAIKVMSAEVRNDPDFVERFRQEARVQAALNHPNVALLFDYFVHDGAPVAVMEFIEGESLEELIRRRGALPAREAIPIFKQALRGVAAAHRAGIIHRDLKPANLMLTKDGIVKVMDFGIAKRQGVTGATKVSTSIGSPLYMAPEQILGRAVDCRTDVYGLGITLYELVSGYKPFNPRGKAEYLVLDAHVNDVPEPPTVYRFGIPQPIVDAVMRSLAKEPEARFQSADEFAQALPDVPAPDAAAPGIGPTSAVAPPPAAPASGVGATGTVPLPPAAPAPRVGPTGTVALAPNAPAPRVGPTGTVALGASPPLRENSVATRKQSGTVAIDYSPSMSAELAATRKPSDTMAFEYSAGTMQVGSDPRRSALAQPPRANRPVIVIAIVATLLVVAALVLGAHRHAPTRASTAKPTPISTEPAAPPAAAAAANSGAAAPVAPPSANPTGAQAATDAPAVPAATAPLTAATPAAQADLSGTWRGEYVDASGKQLLRVVSLSIGRVYDNGGVEGTLKYESASGGGECKLHPRGSIYWAGERRLQLSPEGCSLHYPRELGVPVNFNGVNPRANILKNGRIDAPTGEVIRVRLKRTA